MDKPLTPINGGVIVVVGAKASNFDVDIKENPRVILWSSQDQNWWSKDLPSNCKAVFFTRFVGHAAFSKIVTEARQRQITIFNPQGTGTTARQIRELLGLIRSTSSTQQPVTKIEIKETPMTPTIAKSSRRTGSIARIRELIVDDRSRNQFERIIAILRKEGSTATEASLKTMIAAEVREKFNRRERGQIREVVKEVTPKPLAKSSEQHDLLKMLDDVTLTMELIRGEVIRLTELQNKLKEFIK